MESSPGHALEYVERLAARGRYFFSSSDAQGALEISAAATKLALNRLSKKGVIASPARGYYVFVPPEYRALGCLPADQFIPDLMQRLELPYYVGLLSAAQYHGAAHQRPQELQVFLMQHRRPIHCGRVRVSFITKRALKDVPIERINTERGTLVISSPEATALDLIGYLDRAGGLDQVAVVLSELAERLDSEKLARAAVNAPMPWAQRLGYVLDRFGFQQKTEALKDYVRCTAKEPAVLLPGSRSHARRDNDWKLDVNANVETES